MMRILLLPLLALAVLAAPVAGLADRNEYPLEDISVWADNQWWPAAYAGIPNQVKVFREKKWPDSVGVAVKWLETACWSSDEVGGCCSWGERRMKPENVRIEGKTGGASWAVQPSVKQTGVFQYNFMQVDPSKGPLEVEATCGRYHSRIKVGIVNDPLWPGSLAGEGADAELDLVQPLDGASFRVGTAVRFVVQPASTSETLTLDVERAAELAKASGDVRVQSGKPYVTRWESAATGWYPEGKTSPAGPEAVALQLGTGEAVRRAGETSLGSGYYRARVCRGGGERCSGWRAFWLVSDKAAERARGRGGREPDALAVDPSVRTGITPPMQKREKAPAPPPGEKELDPSQLPPLR